MSEKRGNFDRILTSIMLSIDNGTEEFLDIIFDYMKRKTDFDFEDNKQAKKATMQALEKHLSLSKTPNVKVVVNANDSFDDFPPGYENDTANDDLKNAHVVVRKKSERKKLKGYSCLDCSGYYDSHNLPEEEKAKIIQRCSKHRSTNPPPLHSPNKAPFIIIFL